MYKILLLLVQRKCRPTVKTFTPLTCSINNRVSPTRKLTGLFLTTVQYKCLFDTLLTGSCYGKHKDGGWWWQGERGGVWEFLRQCATIYRGLLLVMGGGRARARVWVEVCCQDLQTLNLFKAKSTHFTTLFKTRNHFTCTRPLFISICKDKITYYYVQ